MSWWDSSRVGYGRQLQSAAVGLAEHAWPVLPGTFWEGRAWCGRPGSRSASQAGPLPIPASGLAAATTDPARAAAWWSGLPYSILVATGTTVDVIEVAATVGRQVRTILRARGVTAPALSTTAGRWRFAVRAGQPLRPELDAQPEVMLYGRGSYIVAPPSDDAHGAQRWEIGPWACRWQLPDPYDVQYAVLTALGLQPAAVGDPAGELAGELAMTGSGF